MPRPPQFVSLVPVLIHAPFTQICVSGHTLPQLPQLFRSFPAVPVQAPVQQVSSSLHA